MERSKLEAAMRRALEIARRGPAADPNPQVGCVLLDPEGHIVAEGWHHGAGTPHAEVVALAALPEEWRGREHQLTAVVTLEPCNHTGRTGPCAVMLAKKRIGATVYAVSDPGSASGHGADTLRAAGVKVTGGVLEAEGRLLLAPWLARVAAKDESANEHAVAGASTNELAQLRPRPRPHITVKWAQTLDGRAAASDGSSQWITGAAARADVHARRAAADAILVGTGTLIADNPSLTARDSNGELLVPAIDQPLPVVLGKRDIPVDAAIRHHPALAAHGLRAPLHFPGNDLHEHLAALHARGVRTLFVEGGPTVASTLIAHGLVDEALVYVAPALLGGPRLALGELGIENISDIKRLTVSEFTQLGDDLLVRASFADATPVEVSPQENEERH